MTRLCRVAYLTPDGRRIELSTAERDRLLLQDRAVRRAVLGASRMHGTRGTLVLLDPPRVAVSVDPG